MARARHLPRSSPTPCSCTTGAGGALSFLWADVAPALRRRLALLVLAGPAEGLLRGSAVPTVLHLAARGHRRGGRPTCSRCDCGSRRRAPTWSRSCGGCCPRAARSPSPAAARRCRRRHDRPAPAHRQRRLQRGRAPRPDRARRRRAGAPARPLGDRRRRLSRRHARDRPRLGGAAAVPDRARGTRATPSPRAPIAWRWPRRRARSTTAWRARTGAASRTSASSTATSSCRPRWYATLLARFAADAGARHRRRPPGGALARGLADDPDPRPSRPRRGEALQPASAWRRSTASPSAWPGTRSTRPTRGCAASRPSRRATSSRVTTVTGARPTGACAGARATASARGSSITAPSGRCCGR